MIIKVFNNLGFATLLNITNDGIDKVVTPIINEITVPIFTPLVTSAWAIGMVPKILA